ncbi:hypothetical protein BpHYR1_035753 [Brachionus plicatilis]|uniref:Transmembrane protein n=1 Tax=Brachionus plicatilis TaxID=10195 RepID=A0A3M7ST45_BRAPC|nr:hypothetical protein BpHYR1_035753 [Brachionus plicatilis]
MNKMNKTSKTSNKKLIFISTIHDKKGGSCRFIILLCVLQLGIIYTLKQVLFVGLFAKNYGKSNENEYGLIFCILQNVSNFEITLKKCKTREQEFLVEVQINKFSNKN